MSPARINSLVKRFPLIAPGITIAAAAVMVAWLQFSSPDAGAVSAAAEPPGLAQAIAGLHRLYPVFRDADRRADLSLDERIEAEGRFIELLAAVPLDFLVPRMERYEVAYEAQLAQMTDPRAFVDRLAAVAMNGILTPARSSAREPGPIRFRRAMSAPDLR